MHSPASDWMAGFLAKRPEKGEYSLERERVVMDFPINRIPAGGTAALFICAFPASTWHSPARSRSISGTFGQQIPTPVRLAMTEFQKWYRVEQLSRPYNVLKM